LENPFLTDTNSPLAAIQGLRGGYVQLAPTRLTTTYQDLPDTMLLAAKAWAVKLEALGAKRVYWITLSEMLPHLHIHLYPRWSDDELRGLPLFEQREHAGQPPWTDDLAQAFDTWAKAFDVTVIPH
jgi:diadenosine tetraphosphate (Ap4A) HIT family hydrolase